MAAAADQGSGHAGDAVEVIVGVVGRPHGVRGEVVVDLRTDEPDRRFAAGEVLRVEHTTRTFRVLDARPHGGRLLVRFAELVDRSTAEQARGLRLVADVDPAERPSEPEEYFDRQLVGLSVLGADGTTTIGRVIGVLHLPAQDLLEIEAGAQRHLVPLVNALVLEIDLVAGQVRLADMPGLLGESVE